MSEAQKIKDVDAILQDYGIAYWSLGRCINEKEIDGCMEQMADAKQALYDLLMGSFEDKLWTDGMDEVSYGEWKLTKSIRQEDLVSTINELFGRTE